MSRITKLDPDCKAEQDFADFLSRQAYANAEEDRAAARARRLIIENGDPECQQVIAALEQGWINDQER